MGGISSAASSPFLHPRGSGSFPAFVRPEHQRASVVSVPGRAGDQRTCKPLKRFQRLVNRVKHNDKPQSCPFPASAARAAGMNDSSGVTQLAW